jgi:hypothetical protein
MQKFENFQISKSGTHTGVFVKITPLFKCISKERGR